MQNQLVLREVVDSLTMELFSTVIIQATFFVDERFAFQIFEQIDGKWEVNWSFCIALLNSTFRSAQRLEVTFMNHLYLFLELFDVSAILSTS